MMGGENAGQIRTTQEESIKEKDKVSW